MQLLEGEAGLAPHDLRQRRRADFVSWENSRESAGVKPGTIATTARAGLTFDMQALQHRETFHHDCDGFHTRAGDAGVCTGNSNHQPRHTRRREAADSLSKCTVTTVSQASKARANSDTPLSPRPGLSEWGRRQCSEPICGGARATTKDRTTKTATLKLWFGVQPCGACCGGCGAEAAAWGHNTWAAAVKHEKAWDGGGQNMKRRPTRKVHDFQGRRAAGHVYDGSHASVTNVGVPCVTSKRGVKT